MDYQRQLLAELMNPLIPVAKKDFRDPEFCKHHLAGFCPFEIFMNTKVDVQKCNLVHDDNLQKEYQSLPAAERIYDHRFYDYLGRLLSDVERTIKRGHSRLEQKSDVVFDNLDEIREKICILEETIGPQVERICAFGEAGKVAEAMDAHYFIYKLFNELERTRENDPSQRNYRPDKRMEVCQVCGALLANDSTGGRIEAHMIGKQHTGFIRIRKVLEEHAKKTGRDYSRSAPLSSSSSNPPHLSNPDSHYNNRDRDHRGGGGGVDRDYRGGGDRGYRGGGRYDDRSGGGYKSGGGGGYRGGGRGDYGRRR